MDIQAILFDEAVRERKSATNLANDEVATKLLSNRPEGCPWQPKTTVSNSKGLKIIFEDDSIWKCTWWGITDRSF